MSRLEKLGRPAIVSIGMPVYNGEDYIREALDSLLAQTFTEFELIISDNASTDNTRTICSEYAARDSRIRYFRQHTNIGAYGNFLAVLAMASTSYFMWAAADDRWDPDWLAALLRQLNGDVSIAFGCAVPFLDSGKLGSRFALKSLVGPAGVRMLRYYMWWESGAKACAIYGLYRTSELRKVAHDVLAGMTGERWGADVVLVFAMLGRGCLRVDPTVVLYKRVRNISGSAPRRRAGLLGSPVELFLASSRNQWFPYLSALVRHSHPGGTRWAVLAAAPVRYVHLVLNWLKAAVAAKSDGKVARLPLGISSRWFTRGNDWASETRRLTKVSATEPIAAGSPQSGE